MKAILAVLAATMLMAQAAPPATAPVAAKSDMALWRLDCGRFDISDMAMFSDTGRYDGKPYKLVDSCYLIKHGNDYLLWDTGLDKAQRGREVVEGPFRTTVDTTIREQLAKISVSATAIRYVGISHYHDDHIGQVDDFPAATLLVGAGDWGVINSAEGQKRWPRKFAAWKGKRAKVEPIAGDKDVFGDGTVKVLAMPGHTPGHHSLLVKLPGMGAVLLSGDQFHLTESYRYNQVPVFNTDRADTLASSARFREIAVNTRATIVLGHEPDDVKLLPAFPKAAR